MQSLESVNIATLISRWLSPGQMQLEKEVGRREDERGNNLRTRQGKGDLHLILNCPPGLRTP